MTRRQQRMLGVAVLVAGLGLASMLALTAFRKNLMTFYIPSDLVAAGGPITGKLRLGGLVERGSFKRAAGLKMDFVVADCAHRIPVHYEGVLPDLFREGQGVVATGSMTEQGVFVAEEVLAKHDENYMPPQVAEALEAQGGHNCETFKSVSGYP